MFTPYPHRVTDYVVFSPVNDNTKTTIQTFEEQLTSASTNGPQHQTQLTLFKEAEEETIQTTPLKPQLRLNQVTNPFPDQTPTAILSRNYKIATYNWTPTSVFTSYNFPGDLLAYGGGSQPLMDILQGRFRYFRSGVKIEIRINATQFHFGALMVSWLPNHVASGINDHAANVYQQSGNHPVVISASTQNAVTITVPWINPYDYMDIYKRPLNTIHSWSDICKLYIAPLTPLGMATEDVTDSVDVQIFASLVDVQTAGYVVHSSDSTRGFKKEAKLKSQDGIIAGVATATQTVTSVLDAIPMIGGLVEKLSGVLCLLDKPTSLQASQPVHCTTAHNIALGEGLDNSQSLSLLPLTNLSIDSTLMGDNSDKSLLSIVGVPMLRRVFSFNQTNKVMYTRVHVNDESCSFQPDYLAYISNMFRFWRGSIKYHIRFFCSTFTTCRFKISLLYSPPGVDTPTTGDIINIMADVKGDTELEFSVPFLNITPYKSVQDTDAENDPYPMLQILATTPINGPSTAVVPTIYCTVWRAGADDFIFNELKYYQRPTPPVIPPPSTTSSKFTVHSDIQDRFKRTFPPILEGCSTMKERGVVTSERIESVRQITKRYYRAPYIGTAPAPLTNQPDWRIGPSLFNSVEQGSPLAVLSLLFKYQRGSRRCKIVLPFNMAGIYKAYLNPNTQNSGFTVVSPCSNGTVITNNNGPGSGTPILEFEIPYYNQLPFIPNNTSDVNFFRDTDIPTTAESNLPSRDPELYIAAGDDFDFGFLIAPLFIQ